MDMQVLDVPRTATPDSDVADTVAEGKSDMGKVLVEKRDGRIVEFDPINIISAVKSAFKDLDKEIGPEEEQLIRDLANQVEGEIKERYNGPAKI